MKKSNNAAKHRHAAVKTPNPFGLKLVPKTSAGDKHERLMHMTAVTPWKCYTVHFMFLSPQKFCFQGVEQLDWLAFILCSDCLPRDKTWSSSSIMYFPLCNNFNKGSW